MGTSYIKFDPIRLGGRYLVSSQQTFAQGAQFPAKIAKAVSPQNLRQLSKLYKEISTLSASSMTPQIRMTLNIVAAEIALLEIAQRNEGMHCFATYSSEELFNDALSRLVTVSKSDAMGSRRVQSKTPSKKRISKKSDVSFPNVNNDFLGESSLKLLGAIAAIRLEKTLPRDRALFDFVQSEATLFRMFVASNTVPSFVLEAIYNNCVINLSLLARRANIVKDKIPALNLCTTEVLDAPATLPLSADQKVEVESASTAIIRGTVEAMGLSDQAQKEALLNASVSLDRMGVGGVQERLDKISKMFGQESTKAIMQLVFIATIAETRKKGLTKLDTILGSSYAFNYSVTAKEVSKSSGGRVARVVSEAFCDRDGTSIILVDQERMPWLTNNEGECWASVMELGDLFVFLWLQLDLLKNSSIDGIEIRILSENGVNPEFAKFLHNFFFVSGINREHSSAVLTYCHRDVLDSDPVLVLEGAKIVKRSENSRRRGEIKKAKAEEVFEEVKEAVLKTKVVDEDDVRLTALELATHELFPVNGFVDSAEEFVQMEKDKFSGENPGKVVIGWMHEIISLADAAERFRAGGNPLVRVNAHPRPIDYVPLKVDSSGRVTGKGARKRKEVEIEIDGVLKDGTWFETKRKMNLAWLQNGGVVNGEEDEVFSFLSQARKYAQALREKRTPAVIYRLTVPAIHPDALREFEKAFGDQANKVTVLHYTEDLTSSPTIHKLSGKTKKKKKSKGKKNGDANWGKEEGGAWLWLHQELKKNPESPNPLNDLDKESSKKYSNVKSALRHVHLIAIKKYLMGLLRGRRDRESRRLRGELNEIRMTKNTLSKAKAQEIARIARQIRAHIN